MKEDRNEHYNDLDCPCNGVGDKRTVGKVFSRFADHPKVCSGPCCGNPRRFLKSKTKTEILSKMKHNEYLKGE